MHEVEYGLDKSRVNYILKRAEEERQLHHPGSDYSSGISFVMNLIRGEAAEEDYERRSSIGDSGYF